MRWSALLIVFITLPAAAELYRWTDDNGKVHYSDRPITEQAEQLEERAPPKIGQGDTVRQMNERLDRLRASEAEREAKEQEQAAKLKAKQDKLRAQCAQQKNRLSNFQNHLMYTINDDGSHRFYEKEEVQQKIAEISTWIAENCSN